MRARNMDGSGAFNTDADWDLSNTQSRHYKAKNTVLQNVQDPALLQRLVRDFQDSHLHEMCSAIASSLMPSASELTSQITEHVWQQGDDVSSFFTRAANSFAALRNALQFGSAQGIEAQGLSDAAFMDLMLSKLPERFLPSATHITILIRRGDKVTLGEAEEMLRTAERMARKAQPGLTGGGGIPPLKSTRAHAPPRARAQTTLQIPGLTS
jgi:hypothetical protein